MCLSFDWIACYGNKTECGEQHVRRKSCNHSQFVMAAVPNRWRPTLIHTHTHKIWTAINLPIWWRISFDGAFKFPSITGVRCMAGFFSTLQASDWSRASLFWVRLQYGSNQSIWLHRSKRNYVRSSVGVILNTVKQPVDIVARARKKETFSFYLYLIRFCWINTGPR